MSDIQILTNVVQAAVALGVLFAGWAWYAIGRLRMDLKDANDRAARAIHSAYGAEEMIRAVALAAGLEWQPPAPGTWRKP